MAPTPDAGAALDPSPLIASRAPLRGASPSGPSGHLPHKGGGEKVAHASVPEKQRSQAKGLRREMTPAERKLRHALKAHRFSGLHIRRQVPMGAYIADFVCHEARVVIEVDGAQHGFAREAAADHARNDWFVREGYKVLRFWNREVLFERDVVLDTIFAHVQHALPSAGGELR